MPIPLRSERSEHRIQAMTQLTLFCAEPHQPRNVCAEVATKKMGGMAAWLRGKRVLIVDEDYVAASRLETRLLHWGALVVGPVTSSLEAFNCLVNEEVDAAVLSPAPDLRTSVLISDVLSRLRIPFVVLSKEPMSSGSDRYADRVVGKPGKAETIARLLANAASAQDNTPGSARHAQRRETNYWADN
jgi:hypothetical protein